MTHGLLILFWSNLYKISPAAGGNPAGKLRSLQRECCISLLEAEIQIYRPRRLLFLTGQDWAKPFLHRLVPNVINTQGSHVRAVGELMTTANEPCVVVVATHPQSKREFAWVQEVFQAFDSLM